MHTVFSDGLVWPSIRVAEAWMEGLDAIQAAIDQDAFVIWNHPGYQQVNKIPVWYDIQSQLYEKGWIHGMEIVNSKSYYPLAYKWCIEKNISILGCSDVHGLIMAENLIEPGSHRPLTLDLELKEAVRNWSRIKIPFTVSNLLIAPDQGLEINLALVK